MTNKLPIHQVLPDLINQLKHNSSAVLQADPGAGKSTVVPLELLKVGYLAGQKIIMLEPRRMAARSLATYMAKCLGEKVGETVGYQVKNDKKISANTRLEILTEGVLLRRLQQNQELEGVGLVIFDEFHERALNADLSLMLTLEIQQILREDLRILVMSATLNTSLLSHYLDDAPVVFCQGRVYPVTVDYQRINNPKTSHQKVNHQLLASGVCQAIHQVINEPGDILVFLAGIADINKCMSQASAMFTSAQNIRLVPLHGSLPLVEQERAITPDPNGIKKIIFTTNIAETSLTIEGITCVIDSGLEKKLAFNPSSGMSKLITARISQASAEQRKGRAGRLSAGKCIRLWSETEHLSLSDFQPEEILNADLADAVLELARCGHTQYQNINWLTPPPEAHFSASQQLLIQLGMLSGNGKITPAGSAISHLPVHPRLAKMIYAANGTQERQIACIIAGLLSERDIFQGSDSADLLLRIHSLIEYQQGNRDQQYIKRHVLSIVLQDIRTLQALIKQPVATINTNNLSDVVAYLLLQAFPERLAKRRGDNSNKYQLANGKGVFIHEGDPLFKDEYLVVNDCDAQQKEGRVYSAVGFNVALLFEKYAHGIVEQTDYELSSNKTNVYARIMQKYGNIVLTEKRTNDVPSQYLLDCIKALIKTDASSILTLTAQCENWLQRVQWLGEKMVNFPTYTHASMMAAADVWLLPYITNIKSIPALKKVKIYPLLSSLLSYEENKMLEQEAPVTYLTPSNKQVPIVYSQHHDPTVSVVLQELFGELKSPTLAGNSVALRFELLSPARRPIQITSDLANFWGGSYIEVAKDMRAKYPKHRWPEKPLLEKAGASFKRR